ncbi:MAG: DUF2169 domain-containing protein [Planctomycetota bacterium]
MDLYNPTPLTALLYRHRNAAGVAEGCCIAKATYRIEMESCRRVQLTQVEAELVTADVGSQEDPDCPWRLSEICPPKVATDVLFPGLVARSRWGRSQRSWNVELEVGSLSKTLVVTGQRYATRSLLGWNVEMIQPTDAVVVSYSNAYGGQAYNDVGDVLDFVPENPVGRGVELGTNRSFRPQRVLLPQVGAGPELIRNPLRYRQVVGVGPVPRAWSPRRELAGTFGTSWAQDRAPLMPPDFTDKFYSESSDGLRFDGFAMGNELVRMSGVHPEGVVAFQLPANFEVGLLLRSNSGSTLFAHMQLDTISIDLSGAQLDLIWRASFPRDGQEWEGALGLFPTERG